MTDVFISYSRKDKDFVRRLYEALEAQGYDAWVDWDDIDYAEDWWKKICAGIEVADNFVFVISPDSVQSKVCYDEVEHATETVKRVVPLLYRNITEAEDHTRMHPSISRHNWLPFSEEDAFESALSTLIDTLNTNPQHVRLHTRLLVRAIEWDDAGRPNSLLLRGGPLQEASAWLTAGVDDDPPPSSLQAEFIAASQQLQQQRTRTILGAVSMALVITIGLMILSLILFQQSESRLDLAQERGTAVAQESDQRATQQFLAEVAEATAVRSAAESQALALAANARQALSSESNDLALALALEAVAMDDPPSVAREALVAAAFSPRTAMILEGHQSAVSFMSISPDGRWLLTGGNPPAVSANAEDSTPTELILWDLQTGNLLNRVEILSFVQESFVENLGQDVVDLQIEQAGLAFLQDRIQDMRFADDGQTAILATGLTVIRWDVVNWELIDFTLYDSNAFHADIHPTEDTIYYADVITSDRTTTDIYELDVTSGAQQVIASVPGQVWFITTSAEDIALGLGNGDVVLLDRNTLTEKSRWSEHTDTILSMAFNPSETWLISASNSEVIVWDVTSGALLNREPLDTFFDGEIVFTADGQSVVWGASSGQIVIRDAETFEIEQRLLGHTLPATVMAFTHDEAQLISAGEDQTIRLWDLQVGEQQRLTLPDNRVRSVIMAEGRVFAGLGDGPQTDIIAWDLETNTLTNRLVGHTDTVADLDLNADETLLVSAGFDNTVRFWDAESGELVNTIETDTSVISVDFSDDGQFVAAGLATRLGVGAVAIWDVMTFSEVQRIPIEALASGITFTADDTQVIAALNPLTGMSYLATFDVETGDELMQFVGGHTSLIIDADVSSDGRYLLSNGQSTIFYLWDMESGEIIQQFVGHNDEVREARFTSDDQIIVSVSFDDTIRIWDVSTGSEIASFTSHRDNVASVDISRDGERFVTGANDRTLRLWQVPRWRDNLPHDLQAIYTFTCQESEQYRLDSPCEGVAED